MHYLNQINAEDAKAIGKIIEENFSKYHHMNYGGCGFFATLMHLEMKKVGVEADIVFLRSGSYEVEEVEEMLEGTGKTCINEHLMHVLDLMDERISKGECYQSLKWKIPNGHIGIRINNYIFDSDGYRATDEAIAAPLNADVAERLNQADCWNDTFEYYHKDELGDIAKDVAKTVAELAMKYDVVQA